MAGNEKIEPQRSGNDTDVSPLTPHNPDPVNPMPEPAEDTERGTPERPDWDWAEHED